MSGPIVRTGTTPEFWKNYERIFGVTTATEKKIAGTKSAKKKVAKPKATKQAAAPKKAAKKSAKKKSR